MTKGSFPNVLQIKEVLGYITKEKKINRKIKKKYHMHSFSLEFSKSCLAVEAKIITLSDVVLGVCKGNI
jgi:hypothetical protein